MISTTPFAARLRLHAEIALWRYGWVWVMVLVSIGALAIGLWWLPHQNKALQTQEAMFVKLVADQDRLKNSPKIAAPASSEELSLAQLAQLTYTESELSDILRQIGQIAKAQGLVLTQSEFQTSNEGHGGLRQVQVSLPVRASYPQARQFIELILRKFPGVSLDQLVLKRETVALNQADIRLKFSVWINPQKIIQTNKGKP